MSGATEIWAQVKPYRRKFCQPLSTSHGLWPWREGLLLKLTDASGRVGFGEIAPLPWFGTETLEAAWLGLRPRMGGVDCKTLLTIPDHLPASQFGVETALDWLRGNLLPPIAPLADNKICGLLPAGRQALDNFPDLVRRGYRVCKWKIGVFPPSQEIAWLKGLVGQAQRRCRLRLDANGGLSYKIAETWLHTCDALRDAQTSSAQAAGPHLSPVIEYLEQPLPPSQLATMQQLCQQFQTPIALDESVANLTHLQTDILRAWPGYFVIKPAIAGFPSRLIRDLKQLGKRIIFSSTFETVIGRRAALATALAHYQQVYPQGDFPSLGFNTLGYFEDDWDRLEPEQLWTII